MILFIASANSGAIETTFILSINFSGSIGIVFVTTNSLIGEFCILSIAGPTSTPCVAPAYISFAPCSFNIFAASTSVPAVLTSSSNISAVFPSISPIIFVATALSLLSSLLLSINANGQLKKCEYLYAFLELPASVATTTMSFKFFVLKYFSNKCFAVSLSQLMSKYA